LKEWQGDTPTRLQRADLVAASNRDCRNRIEKFTTAGADIGDDILCADSQDGTSLCAGDSGGPGFVKSSGSGTWVQVGVSSFTAICDPDDIPDGFARVSFFYEWIQEQICALSQIPPSDCPPTPPPDPKNVPVLLEFRYDGNAYQTSYAVRSDDSDTIVYSGPEHIPLPAETFFTNFTLPPGKYTFEVYDSGGNGLECSSKEGCEGGDGQWRLYNLLGNSLSTEQPALLTEGSPGFETIQTKQFVVERPSPAPSESPTGAPTSSREPTDTPSESPSHPFRRDALRQTLSNGEKRGTIIVLIQVVVVSVSLFLAAI